MTNATVPGQAATLHAGKAVRMAVWTLVVPACLVGLIASATFMATDLHMNDFGKFYYSTTSFLEGKDLYAPNPATRMLVNTETRQLLNMNPPHFHLLILPLAMFGPMTALWLWGLANVAALILSLRLIASELGLPWTPSRLEWTFAAVVACSATGASVITGQLTFLLLLPVTVAWIAARRGNWTRAAVYLGVCASVKPFLGIFLIYFALRRSMRAVAVMTITGLACTVTGLAVFGWNAYQGWLSALSAVDWTWAPMNGALAGLLTRAFVENPLYTPVVHAPRLGGAVAGILAIIMAAVSLRIFVRDASRDAADRAFGGLLVTAQLVSPLGWIYYLWLLAGPAAALYISAASRPSRVRDVLALVAVPGLLVPVATTAAWSTPPWIGATLGSLYVWTTLFIWAGFLADVRAAGAADRAESVRLSSDATEFAYVTSGFSRTSVPL
jgi:hypothetical protein